MKNSTKKGPTSVKFQHLNFEQKSIQVQCSYLQYIDLIGYVWAFKDSYFISKMGLKGATIPKLHIFRL